MAITMKQKERFIDLRAEGLSYATIAKKMKISKSSCLNMGLDFEKEINNIAFLKIQTIIEKHKLNKINKVESHLTMIEKTITEIENRDLTELTLKELISLKENLETSVRKELEIKYITDQEEPGDFNIMGFPKPKELSL